MYFIFGLTYTIKPYSTYHPVANLSTTGYYNTNCVVNCHNLTVYGFLYQNFTIQGNNNRPITGRISSKCISTQFMDFGINFTQASDVQPWVLNNIKYSYYNILVLLCSTNICVWCGYSLPAEQWYRLLQVRSTTCNKKMNIMSHHCNKYCKNCSELQIWKNTVPKVWDISGTK